MKRNRSTMESANNATTLFNVTNVTHSRNTTETKRNLVEESDVIIFMMIGK